MKIYNQIHKSRTWVFCKLHFISPFYHFQWLGRRTNDNIHQVWDIVFGSFQHILKFAKYSNTFILIASFWVISKREPSLRIHPTKEWNRIFSFQILSHFNSISEIASQNLYHNWNVLHEKWDSMLCIMHMGIRYHQDNARAWYAM